jgi:hypothetical protein
MDDPKPPPEPRSLYTPEFWAKRRRSGFWAMIMCIGMGAAVVVGALYAKDHGGMVTSGAKDGHMQYPWWMVLPVGAALLALGVWGLWRHVTRPDEL